jgi:hypothetical protein
MLAAKSFDENFLQNVGNEIATQADRSHQFKIEIRKHKMLIHGIGHGRHSWDNN